MRVHMLKTTTWQGRRYPAGETAEIANAGVARQWIALGIAEDLDGVNPSYPEPPPGTNIQTVIYMQPAAESTWTITHNLHRYPSVTIVDTNDTVVYATVTYLSVDAVRVTCTPATAGKAYLN